jgi:hypothetical protein
MSHSRVEEINVKQDVEGEDVGISLNLNNITDQIQVKFGQQSDGEDERNSIQTNTGAASDVEMLSNSDILESKWKGRKQKSSSGIGLPDETIIEDLFLTLQSIQEQLNDLKLNMAKGPDTPVTRSSPVPRPPGLYRDKKRAPRPEDLKALQVRALI